MSLLRAMLASDWALRQLPSDWSKGTGLNVALGAHAVSSDSDSYGVVGSATGAVNNYGVFGSAFSGSGDNYAGYFDGALFAISASATVKSFLIDHPLDPANKYLRHSSIESDQRMNIYPGEVTTDSSGLAVVTMPTWFEALNGKIQYQLTVVDESESADLVLTKVSQRLRRGKFKIRTSAPNVTVNWMVSGERHDPTSQLHAVGGRGREEGVFAREVPRAGGPWEG